MPTLEELLAQADAWLSRATNDDLLTAADDRLMELELSPEELAVVRAQRERQQPRPFQPSPVPAPSVNDMKAELGAKKGRAPVSARGTAFNPQQAEENVTDIGITALKGAIGVPEAAVGLADIVSGGHAGRALEDVGFDPGQAKAILDTYYSRRQQEANQSVEEADGFVAKALAALSHPSVIAHSVLESAPLMGAGGLVGRGLSALGLRTATAGAVGEGVVAAGSAAESIRQQTDDGLLTPKQAALSATTGAGTGLIGALGGKIAARLGIDDVDTMLAAGALDPKAQRGLVTQIVLGAAQEGILEELPQSVAEQVQQNAALGRPLTEDVDHAAVMGLLTGAVMGGGVQAVNQQMKPGAPALPLDSGHVGMGAPDVDPTIYEDGDEPTPSVVAPPPVQAPARVQTEAAPPVAPAVPELLAAADAKVDALLGQDGEQVEQDGSGEQNQASQDGAIGQLPVTPKATLSELTEQAEQIEDAATDDNDQGKNDSGGSNVGSSIHTDELITAADSKVKALEAPPGSDADLVAKVRARAEERRRIREQGLASPTSLSPASAEVRQAEIAPTSPQSSDTHSVETAAGGKGNAPSAEPTIAPAGTWRKPEIGTNGEWRENPERNSIEVRFASKPEPKVISALKAARFRWAKSARVWYSTRETAHQDVQRILSDANAGAFAEQLAPSVTKPAAPVESMSVGGVESEVRPLLPLKPKAPVTPQVSTESKAGLPKFVTAPHARPRALQHLTHTQLDKLAVEGNRSERELAAQEREARRRDERDDRAQHTEARKAELKAERDEIIGKLKKKYSSPQAKLVPDDEDIVLMAKFVRNIVQEGALRFEDAVRRFAEAWGEGAADYSDFIEAAWDVVREADARPDMEPAGSFDEVYNRVKDEQPATREGRGAEGAPGDELGGAQPRPGRHAQQEHADGLRGENQGPLEADRPGGDRGPGEARPAGSSRNEDGDRGSRPGGESAGGGHGPDADRGDVAGAVAGGRTKLDGRAKAVPARPGADRHDYAITEAARIGVGSQGEKLKDNLAAIRTLKTIESEGRRATPEEQAVLARYVGWGSSELAAWFKPGSKRYDELRDLLTPEEFEAARASTKNAHFTSPLVISHVWQAIERLGFTGGKVLEPAMGTGHFFGLMPAELRARSSRVGIELDPLTARIAQQLYQHATIFNKGFQDTALTDGMFDLAISNVPFGDFGVHDPAFTGTKRALTRKIHDYFFAKALDKVRPGGVVAFITSHYTLDKVSAKTRLYLGSQAKFLGAIRLPMTAFKENAGTDVVTDIIFLQKASDDVRAGSGPAWFDAKLVSLKNKYGDDVQLPVNEYFIAHPEMIVGTLAGDGTMYGGGGAVNVHPPADMSAALAEAVSRLPQNVMEPPALKLEQQDVQDIIPAPGHVLPNAYTVKGDLLYQRDGDQLVRYEGKREDRIKAILPVRDAMRGAMRAMVTGSTDREIAAAQRELNKAYDTFVQRHGFLNTRENLLAFKDDPDSAAITQLEIWNAETQTATKADIFEKRTIYPPQSFAKADTPDEALHISLLERGRIDWPRMAELTGKTEQQLQDALLGKVFRTPAGDWQTADAYLSGNVKEKLAEAEAAAKADESLAVNIEALRAVLPEDIKPTEVDYRLGAGWIDPEVYEDFIAHLLEWGHATGNSRPVRVRYVPELGLFGLTDRFGAGRKDAGKWSTRDMSAVTLVDHAMNSRIPTVRRTDPNTKKSYVDAQATEAARAKLDAIKVEFKKWVLRDTELAQRLTDIYNRDFNNWRPRTFDGSHLATLPGMAVIDPNVDLDKQLRPHQKNVIWRILQEGRALMAHEVGAGKTYAMIGAAMEMRRLGLARKPMFVVPNNILQQWRDDILKMYPGAKVLMASEDDFNPANRKRLAARIATGDWDAVLVPQSSFGKIGMSHEAQRAFIQEQLDILEDYIKDMVPAGGRTSKRDPSVKQLEAAKARLEAKLEKLEAALEKDTSSVSFEMLGVDFLMVDEAHEYKNLWFPTKMSNISGVGGTEAGRAQDMFLKVRHLQKLNRGRGIVMATGTPISNTVGEMFTMQRYLMFDELERMGLAHFDAWVQQFADVVTKTEWAPTGGFRQKSRLGTFVNAPELLTMWRSIADVQTAADLNLPTPKIKGGKQQQVALKPSDIQLRYMESLVARMKAIKDRKVEPSEDNPLKVTGDAKKAAIDMRLVSPGLPDDPNNRVNDAAERVYRIYQANDHRKGTQLVFLDMGTPKPQRKKLPVKAKDDTVAPVEEPDGFDDSTFNLYDDIKKKLVMRGIPADQVAFIHDAKTHADRKVLFQKMREGEIRVLLASSMKGGVGMNVQRRLVALHHLDAPWRPLDIAQRNGRILRQGNLFYEQDPEGFEVEIYHYVTEKLFDGYIWQLIGNKAKFIQQVMTGRLKGRQFADETGDVTLSPDEVIALASGDPLVMERVEVDAKLRRLEAVRNEWEQERWEARARVANLPGRIERTRKLVESYEAIIAKREQPEEFVGTVGTEYKERKDAGEALVAAVDKLPTDDQWRDVGEYAGFTIKAGRYETTRVDQKTGERASGRKVALWMDGEDFPFNVSESPVGTIRSMELAAASQPDAKLGAERAHLVDMEKELGQLQRRLGEKFDEEDQFQALLVRQREIQEALGIGKSDANATGEEGGTAAEADADEDGDVSAMAGAKIYPPRRPAVPVQPRAKVVNIDQMRPSELVQFIRREFGTPTRVGRFRQRALGIYKHMAQVIRVKTANDMPTVFHELGHHIQMSVLKLDKRASKAMMTELRGLGGPTSRQSYTVEQQLDEGTAEFLRIWFEEGDQMVQALAPNFYAEFMAKVKGVPLVWRALQEAQRQWQGHADLDPHERGKARIDFDGKGGRADDISTTLKAQRATIDDLVYLDHAVKAMAKGQPIDLTQNAYALARLARGAVAKAMGFIEHGVRRNDGRFIGTSLAAAIKDIEPGELEDFATYLVASRVPELHRRGVTNTAMNLAEARGTLQKFAGNQRFEDARDAVYAFQSAMLDYAEEQRLISSRQRQAMEDANQHYVPFERVMDGFSGGSHSAKNALANQGSPFKRIRGSGRDIVNPLETIIKNAHLLVQVAEQNRAALALVDLANQSAGSGRFLDRIPEQKVPVTFSLEHVEDAVLKQLGKAGVDVPSNFDLKGVTTIFTPAMLPSGKSGIVTVLRDGKREWYQVNDPALYAAIVDIGPKAATWAWAFTAPAQLLRATATGTLGFIARNPIRDTFTAYAQSRYGFRPFVDTVVGLANVLGKTELYQQFLASGAGHSTLVARDRQSVRREIRKLSGAKAESFRARMFDTVRTPFELLQALSEVMEHSTRLGEFRLGVMKETAAGTAPDEAMARAALAARDVTVDFARAGTQGRSWNEIVPFLNARVQGYDRAVQTARERPATFALRAAASVTALSVLTWVLNADDEEYEKIPEWEKNTYWHIPVPYTESGFIRLPKPFEIGTLFGTLPEAFLDYAYGKDPEGIKARLRQAFPFLNYDNPLDGVLEVIGAGMPTLFLPAFEVMANYDTFRDRNIISPYELDQEAELLANRWTSGTAIWLGKALNYPPAKIDHLIYGYTAGMGRGIVKGIDTVASLLGLTERRLPAPDLDDAPLVGTFYRSRTTSDVPALQRLYELERKARGAVASRNAFERRGEPEKAAAVEDEHAELLNAVPGYRAALREIREVRGQIDALFADTTMGPVEKRDAMNELHREIEAIAADALGVSAGEKQPVPFLGRLPVVPRR